MKAYFSYINARRGPDGKRGVCGRQIVFKYYDDGYNPVNSVQQQRRLVEQDKVFAVVGTLGTEVNQAVQPYLNSNKVPHVLVSTGASDFGKDYKKYPWTIGWQPDYVAEGRLYGLDINKNHPNAKIAILYQNDSYGKDYVAGFKSALGTAKVTEPGRPRGGVTCSAAARRSLQLIRLRSSGADTLMIFVTPTPTIQAYAILRALNWKPANIYVNSVSATDTFMGAAVRELQRGDGERVDQRPVPEGSGVARLGERRDGEAVPDADGEVQPERSRDQRAQLLRLRQGGHVRPGDVQGREEPDAGRA